MSKFEVFLSFKNSTSTGEDTFEVTMADELYSALVQRGVSVFYSKRSLERLGVAQYKAAIDSALDDSKVLVAVGTSTENLNSSWVRYEWDGFYSDILSGQKKGQVFSYIDRMSPSALPRTLRQLQTFERRTVGVDQVCSYILHALGRSEPEQTVNPPLPQKTPEHTKRIIKPLSTHSYLDDKEKERLSSQARLVCDNDVETLKGEIKARNFERKLHVLDLGCADGYLTERVFRHFGDSIEDVVGIDAQEVCVRTAKESIADGKYHFLQANLESDDWDGILQQLMNQLKIGSFDIIFSALMFHHLRYPERLLRKIRRYLSSDGFLYIRTCDDDEIEAYPDQDNLIKNTLLATYDLEGVSDRIHGKKIYGQLYRAGYKRIVMHPYYVTTSNMDIEARQQFFFDIFYWRKNRYKKRLDNHPEDEEYLNELNMYCETMEEIEERFYDPSFYFKVSGPIAIAEK